MAMPSAERPPTSRVDASDARTRRARFLILVAVNFALVTTLAAGYEYHLRRADPFLTTLPFDSFHYATHRIYYPGVVVPDGQYTWGHRVVENSLGFRERELTVPKPRGTCRIMVLGDSFTWGIGLAPDERYTGRAEAYLREAFPGRALEVLSFGIPGASTMRERDVLQTHKERVQPDLIVVGFVANDPEPRYQGYSIERERFLARYGWSLNAFGFALGRIGLGRTARSLRRSFDALTVRAGWVPSWEEGMERVYEERSPEWGQFQQALHDIKKMSDHLGLVPPLFAVLNPLMPRAHATDYRARDDSLPQFLRWLHQGERAAAAAGFRTYNHERELLEHLSESDLFLNALDQHPSARVHEVFGRKLFAMIRSDIDAGLCVVRAE